MLFMNVAPHFSFVMSVGIDIKVEGIPSTTRTSWSFNFIPMDVSTVMVPTFVVTVLVPLATVTDLLQSLTSRRASTSPVMCADAPESTIISLWRTVTRSAATSSALRVG
ncbi:hypothetical protein H257_19102 [Aphanomyces astaci]|uniref:Uncharacterized protein n=1 Tax=Aphanomyces astaci TaxID=112090 RepID=W4FAL3_APHAT|nr:hypothetical protein H257_19102 [Aphanomyces astaci]ETV63964.1 hypothetical protein H257_19102 [Aphanomyces astaci]|eukprot:XP_009846553.1 hypothetical protein H257_19102 [Aphanomyces astaci]